MASSSSPPPTNAQIEIDLNTFWLMFGAILVFCEYFARESDFSCFISIMEALSNRVLDIRMSKKFKIFP